MLKMVRGGVTRLVPENAAEKFKSMGYAVQIEPEKSAETERSEETEEPAETEGSEETEKPAETEGTAAPAKTKPMKKK